MCNDRTWQFGLAILCLAGAASLRAQDAAVRESAPCAPDAPVASCAPAAAAAPSAWFEADYLLWWVRKGPLSAPLLTRGNVNDPLPGVIGQPNTTVLYGGNGIDFGDFSGMRFEFGIAIDPDAVFNIEGGYLTLERRSTSFAAGTDGTGTTVIARPLISVFTGNEFAEGTSFPGSAVFPFSYSGETSITSSTRFQGYELNLSASPLRSEGSRFTLIAGFRALDLDESITIRDNMTPITAATLTFLGNTFDPPSTLTDVDSFRTTNRFYGGQLGGRYGLQMGSFGMEAVGKIALGVTQETIRIDGATALLAPGAPPLVAPGGILALPTNMGSRSHDAFAAVPEVDFEFSYRITPHVQAHVGYSVLYWSDVARPGNSIDRTVNYNQVPSDPAFGMMPGGAARPTFLSTQTSFWAQGINFGLTVWF